MIDKPSLYNSSHDHENPNRVLPFVEQAISSFKHPDRDDFRHFKIRNWTLWKTQQRRCYMRDGFTCVRCKVNFKNNKNRLTVNHIIPVSEDREKWFDLDNLETMCDECHQKLNFEEEERKRQILREYRKNESV